MPENYTVLYGKYQRALISIRELEQDRDRYKNKLEEEQQKQKQIKNKTEYLCSTILKKKRASKNEKADFKQGIEEKLDSAQSYIEEYTEKNAKILSTLTEQQERRTAEIKELKRKIEQLKASRGTDADVSSEPDRTEAGKEEKETKKNADKKNSPPGKNFNVNFSIDGEGDDLLSAELLYSNKNFNTTRGLPAVVHDKKKAKIQEKFKKEAAKQKNSVLQNYLDENDINEWDIALIKIIGSTGKAERKEVQNIYLEQDKNNSSYRADTSFSKLCIRSEDSPDSILETLKTSTPKQPSLSLFRLTDLGSRIYEYLFKKPPVESEWTIIEKNHSSVEHGYGIKNTAELMQDMMYVKNLNANVIYLTRCRDYMIGVGDDKKYIPDIVITYMKNGSEVCEYFEYETGKCPAVDFSKKCNKMAMILDRINIIVPSKAAKDVIDDNIEKWREEVAEKRQAHPGWNKKTVQIKVMTYKELSAQQNKKSISWSISKTVEFPIKNDPEDT